MNSKSHPKPFSISYVTLNRGFTPKEAYGEPKVLLELRQILKEDYNVDLKLEEVLDIALVLVGFAETAMKIEAKSGSS
ncbi:hypothetical protein COY90_02410 [Candidatus Roizmanbacteria bacterium CG_4_10_14_0_8_um_filter_39_9]|uniref:Uncharacterized protein n=1 Tax=Candidatus Roizmanbacteria bacterium CG_4_10_14_0_8_um_filter_39_9 TaxID=1974829 RepID=A0A2M7QCZ9_9BACT|nr:MAG: hypothetical protein COY90_02410 [Candidatus Roizmanbacteria bacterium CG_4_10_14_0_8_um_filter_39_9]